MPDILFLAHRIPFPPDRGDKIRSWNILRHLARFGTVHLACFADDPAEAGLLGALREALGGALGKAHVEVRRRSPARAVAALTRARPLSLALFDSPALRRFVTDVVAEQPVATVYAFSGQMAQFVPGRGDFRFLMDFVDVDSAKFGDYAATGAGLRAWLYRREERLLAAFEREVAARADCSLFVSEAEAALFRRRSGLGAGLVRALGNGVDLDFYRPEGNFPALDPAQRPAGPLIVFTGQMDYRPNVDAVTLFAEQVMPLIRARRADARFAIVGRKPVPAVTALGSREDVIVTGSVRDVRSWLAAADVVVAPLRIARGIQNKLLEAMAMARPAVASPAAFEGIEAEAGRDLLIADDASAQAQAVLGLLEAPERAAGIGAAARRRIESAYSWEARLAPLGQLIGAAPRREAA